MIALDNYVIYMSDIIDYEISSSSIGVAGMLGNLYLYEFTYTFINRNNKHIEEIMRYEICTND